MKLLVISAAFPPLQAGESEHASHLCTRLAARGVNLTLLTQRGNGTGGGAFPVQAIMDRWSFAEMPRLALFIRQFAPDAILLLYTGWLYRDDPMITFAPSLSRKVGRNIRFVTQFEAIVPPLRSLPRRTHWLRRLASVLFGRRDADPRYHTLLRDSDAIVLLSELHRDRLAALLPRARAKMHLIPPPPTLRMVPATPDVRARGRAELGVGVDDTLLAFFGFILPNKGVETLFAALKELLERGRNVRLVMIGTIIRELPSSEAYAATIEGMPARLGIAERVVWTGPYDSDGERASVCLRAADICALPFDDGVVLNRSSFSAAAAHGLPIVTTRGRDVESAIRDGENVLLCPPRDGRALADGIDRLMSSPALRERLQAGALALAHDWYSWDRAVDRTLELLQAPQ